jgi:hypothetical protein
MFEPHGQLAASSSGESHCVWKWYKGTASLDAVFRAFAANWSNLSLV